MNNKTRHAGAVPNRAESADKAPRAPLAIPEPNSRTRKQIDR